MEKGRKIIKQKRVSGESVISTRERREKKCWKRIEENQRGESLGKGR